MRMGDLESILNHFPPFIVVLVVRNSQPNGRPLVNERGLLLLELMLLLLLLLRILSQVCLIVGVLSCMQLSHIIAVSVVPVNMFSFFRDNVEESDDDESYDDNEEEDDGAEQQDGYAEQVFGSTGGAGMGKGEGGGDGYVVLGDSAPNRDAFLDEKMKKMSIAPQKMVALVDGPVSPFPVIFSSWKAHDGQKRLSVAVNLLSGVEAKAVAPSITKNSEIQLTLKWPKATTSVAQFVIVKFLAQLHRYGHTAIGPRRNADEMKTYPFQTVPVVSNLVVQMDKWKKRSNVPGEDMRPSMTINLSAPCQLDPIPVGNSFDLMGLEEDRVTLKSHGYWCGALLLECEGQRNTFRKPVGPDHYTFVCRSNGGWASQQDTDELMEDANESNNNANNQRPKRTRTTNATSTTIAANDLMQENEMLKSRLEEVQSAHTKAVKQMLSAEQYAKSCKKDVEFLRASVELKKHALEQAKAEAETHARAAQEMSNHIHTKFAGHARSCMEMARQAVLSTEKCLDEANKDLNSPGVTTHANAAREYVKKTVQLYQKHFGEGTAVVGNQDRNMETATAVSDFDDFDN